MDYEPVLDQDDIETRQTRDILETELTKVQQTQSKNAINTRCLTSLLYLLKYATDWFKLSFLLEK